MFSQVHVVAKIVDRKVIVAAGRLASIYRAISRNWRFLQLCSHERHQCIHIESRVLRHCTHVTT